MNTEHTLLTTFNHNTIFASLVDRKSLNKRIICSFLFFELLVFLFFHKVRILISVAKLTRLARELEISEFDNSHRVSFFGHGNFHLFVNFEENWVSGSECIISDGVIVTPTLKFTLCGIAHIDFFKFSLSRGISGNDSAVIGKQTLYFDFSSKLSDSISTHR
jgi:hypothetical protein